MIKSLNNLILAKAFLSSVLISFSIVWISGCSSSVNIQLREGLSEDAGATDTAACMADSFISQIQVTLSTQIDSNILIVTGCTESVSISVAGDGNPQIYKNSILMSGSNTVNNGDILFVRLTSSALQSTMHQATLTLGSTSSVFSVTTGDFTPAAFSFTPATGQALSTLITSNQVMLSGFDGSLTATVTGAGSPVILVNGSVVGSSAFVASGDLISVRLTSAATESNTRQATVAINGVTAVFDVTTTGDTTAPTITSLSAPANGSYKQSTNLDFTVNFSESVTVTGTPRVSLDIGGIEKFANYLSGSGTAALVFRYTVEAAMTDSDGIVINPIQLNGGTINDQAGNVSNLTFIAPNTTAVLVDTTAPFVQSVAGPANGSYTPGEHLDFALTFNEAVSVTEIPRLTLTIGSATQYANYLSGTGSSVINFRYTIQTGDLDADGIAVSANIDLNSGTLLDIATNSAILAFTPPNTASVNVTAAILCPTGYVLVPALAPYTSTPFCVAKYEMKNVGEVATSQAEGTPWVSIPRGTLPTTVGGAWKACRDRGAGYDLISNAQWQTIARNLEGVGFNWSSETVGNAGGMSRGHSDGSPSNALAAVADDNDSCAGTGQTCDLLTWSDQRRVHQLSNGSYIWDFAGNVWEWVLDNNSFNFNPQNPIALITPVTHPNNGTIGGVLDNANYHFGPTGNYTNLSTPPFGGLGLGLFNTSSAAIRRGGKWYFGTNSGVFAVALVDGTETASLISGFRCVWSP